MKQREVHIDPDRTRPQMEAFVDILYRAHHIGPAEHASITKERMEKPGSVSESKDYSREVSEVLGYQSPNIGQGDYKDEEAQLIVPQNEPDPEDSIRDDDSANDGINKKSGNGGGGRLKSRFGNNNTCGFRNED